MPERRHHRDVTAPVPRLCDLVVHDTSALRIAALDFDFHDAAMEGGKVFLTVKFFPH